MKTCQYKTEISSVVLYYHPCSMLDYELEHHTGLSM